MALNYPLNSDWSTEEIVKVIDFFNLVEQAYETGVDRQRLLDAYRTFKHIVTSKSEEKQWDQFYFEETGCSSYRTMKQAKQQDSPIVRMKK
ncbi:UPF0223 family protein [Exiguobacterium sp. TDN 0502]|uniref:UPF0223 family protein n=1 Tax=Exiguobacterium sp. TDN 0502 TaxID=3420731 RepID=UPI003D78A436